MSLSRRSTVENIKSRFGPSQPKDSGVLEAAENDAAPGISDDLIKTSEEILSPSSLPSEISPIDTGAQETVPSDAADLTVEPFDAATRELTEDQLVSGNLEKILSEGGVLMDVARSAGDEYAQSRGMLGSSMGAEASMRAMIDTALPIAQQDASAQLSQFQQNQTYAVQQTRDSILQSYQLQMENLSTNNKALLIGLEQQYASLIQSDKNASDVYIQTMESIAEVMMDSTLSVEQQNAGMNDLIGMLNAYLEFNGSISSVNALTGVFDPVGAPVVPTPTLTPTSDESNKPNENAEKYWIRNDDVPDDFRQTKFDKDMAAWEAGL